VSTDAPGTTQERERQVQWMLRVDREPFVIPKAALRANEECAIFRLDGISMQPPNDPRSMYPHWQLNEE